MSKLSRGWFLHAVLLAAAFVILAWSLTLQSGLVAGAVGAVLGTLAAEILVARRYRHWVVWASGLAAIGIGRLLADVVLSWSDLALALSPVVTMQLGEVVRWLSGAFGACVLLRGTALRFRVALAVEGTVAVAAVVATVAGHRDGMIARPLAVSDWFWSQGVDPVVAFLAIGIGAAMLLAGLLLHGRSLTRAILQLALVLLLGVFLAGQIHHEEPPTPPKDAVGGPLEKAKDDPNRREPGRPVEGGQGGGQSSGDANSDLPKAGQQNQNRPAAIVVFHRDVRPASGVFYFRHAAFSQFNGSRLVQATLPGVDPDARSDFPIERRDVEGVPPDALGRVEVATDVALMTQHSRMFALTDAVEVAPRANPDPARFRRAYSVVSKVMDESVTQFIDAAAGNPDWDDRTWELYTELPRDERYHRLAAELQSRLREEFNRSPVALALVVKQYLEETTTYSFSRKYEGVDPTAEFLFSEDRKGYCVHLAHSAAYLMRALGLPTRVSAGYAVEAANLGGGSALLIKSGDAHAWAELYLEGVGWIPIEVTPEKTDVEPPRFEERDLQQMLGEMARREARNERAPTVSLPILSWLRTLWAGVPWALLTLLVATLVVKIWRRWAPMASRRPMVAYRAALDSLSDVGWVREHGESRERFADRVKDVAPSMAALTAGLSGYVLGSVAPPEDRAGGPLDRVASAVANEVRRSTPAWLWLLGLMNPISWWWSR